MQPRWAGDSGCRGPARADSAGDEGATLWSTGLCPIPDLERGRRVNRLDRMALLVFASGLAAWAVIIGLLLLVWLIPGRW